MAHVAVARMAHVAAIAVAHVVVARMAHIATVAVVGRSIGMLRRN
jgi:hypothetical protein